MTNSPRNVAALSDFEDVLDVSFFFSMKMVLVFLDRFLGFVWKYSAPF